MSFLYPRTVSIKRQTSVSGVGALGYGGETLATESFVATGLRAAIQSSSNAARSELLPGSARGSSWYIFVRAKLGSITERDVVVDDLGKRYQVTSAYYNSLGYKLTADLLDT